MRKTFFFDLDGTLLPLELELFIELYYGGIKKSGVFNTICEKEGKEIFQKGVFAMLANDGGALNSEVFFRTVEHFSGVDKDILIPEMNSFYENEFSKIKHCSRTDERVISVIKELKQKGYRLILATNPIFPRAATDQRIKWAGLNRGDFEYVSYYDNSRYCKPNPKYFVEILDHLNLRADDCYIVGNDVKEDMCAVALGFQGFLVLDHVIGDIKKVRECEQGDYSDLLDFARNLPQI